MKAFCYRSGHVMIGNSVPAGAFELADHDNEAELLWVVAYNTHQFRDAEGCPQTVCPHIMLARSESDADISVVEVADAFAAHLRRIKRDPSYMTALIPGPIVPWKDEPDAPGEVRA